jgi:hypothetical protein
MWPHIISVYRMCVPDATDAVLPRTAGQTELVVVVAGGCPSCPGRETWGCRQEQSLRRRLLLVIVVVTYSPLVLGGSGTPYLR